VILKTRVTARTVAAGVATIAAAAMLVGCDRPQPSITVLSGAKAKSVSAQAPCVLTGACNADAKKVTRISAPAGTRILVDVPKDLAQAGWIVAAFTADTSGKNTAINGAGSSPIQGEHNVRVQVPQVPSGGSGAYFLQVSSLRPNNQLTTWVVAVQIIQ
jgi:hypothetical protein